MCWTSLHAHKRKQRKSDMNPLKSIGGQGEPNIVYTWKSKDFTPRNSERRQIQDSKKKTKYLSVTCDSLWFSPDTPVSYTNKNDRHNITEMLLKVA